MALYLIQFVFDRIIQTADSTTFVNGHLQGWVFMKPAIDPFFFPEKKRQLDALKKKFDEGTYSGMKVKYQNIDPGKRRSSLMDKKKRESKTRRSVQFQDVVVSIPNSDVQSEDSSRN